MKTPPNNKCYGGVFKPTETKPPQETTMAIAFSEKTLLTYVSALCETMKPSEMLTNRLQNLADQAASLPARHQTRNIRQFVTEANIELKRRELAALGSMPGQQVFASKEFHELRQQIETLEQGTFERGTAA